MAIAPRARLKKLQRLVSMRLSVEQKQGLALDRAVAAVRETELEIDARAGFAIRLRVEGNEALQEGDGDAWRLNDSQRQFSEWNASALLDLRKKREGLMQVAAQAYRASRIEHEQMASVTKQLQTRLLVERVRGEQRESDDRFLSRRRWLGSRGHAAGDRET